MSIEDIYSSEEKTIYVSEEIVHSTKDGMQLYTYGKEPLTTRVRTVQSSSNGLIESGSAVGNYADIASYILSFIPGIPSMTVSAIFSTVNLIASADQYSQAKTYYSYVQYIRQGEAQWADESGYTPWVFSGKRDYYKHVLAAIQRTDGRWTTETKDYLASPARTDKGVYYDYDNSWFHEQARQRAWSRSALYDLPW